MRTVVFFFLLSAISASSLSQETTSIYDTLRNDALNVYVSTGASGYSSINSNYFRQEVTFINYVRDINVADVYIITARQANGSGGETITYFIVGQNKFSGMNDTILISASRDDTEDIRRVKQVKALKMGLMRYVLKTPLAEYFDIRFTKPLKETITSDNWDSWVFRTNLQGHFNGEKSYTSSNLWGNFDADRVTEKNKLMISLRYGWNDNKFQYEDTEINSYSRSQEANILYVKGITAHWSAGISGEINSSIFDNFDLSASIRPAIEYNIYPYTEATRRQFRFVYRIGYEYCDYQDSTIYGKVKENLGSQSLSSAYRVVQKWGSVNVNLSWGNYLHDWSKNHINLNTNISLRVAKGLSFNIGGGMSAIRNQLSLPKGETTLEELLLRRKQLATQFSYWSNFGLTYTFGSIYNNVVNPRLDRH